LGLSLSLTSYAISASQGLVSVVPDVVRWVFSLLEFTLLALAVTGLFRFVPNIPVQWVHAGAGGLFVALAFEACKKVLAWYLRQVPSYSMVYGAFATVPIFLIWIYLCWVIVLLGAVIAAYAPSLRLGLGRWSEGPGARLGLALAVLDRLRTARAEPPFGLTGAELSYRLRCDPLQVESVFESLESLGWVGRLDDAGPQRHMLLCDPQKTLAAPLLALLMLERTDATDTLWREAALDRVMLSDLMDAGEPTRETQTAAMTAQPG
jgi:membrane protein